jgi:exonuclease III
MDDTKLLNWNVRGLNCAARQEAVKILIQQAGPSIICFQETKLDSMDRFLAFGVLGTDMHVL